MHKSKTQRQYDIAVNEVLLTRYSSTEVFFQMHKHDIFRWNSSATSVYLSCAICTIWTAIICIITSECIVVQQQFD